MNIKLFKPTILSIATYALVALTTIKIIATVFGSPLLAYANNYDFVRQSSCIGVWQSYADKPKTSSNPEQPINSLVFDGKKIRSACMKSSDNLFVRIAATLHAKGDMIDFREISFWKVSFVLLLFLLLLAKTVDPVLKLAFSLAFFLIFGDLVNLLYANTLYLEFSVIAGIFFSLLSTTLLLSTQSKNAALIVLAGISLAWLGFSKQQYMPLAVVFGLICAGALLRKHGDRRLGIAFILMAILTPLIYASMNKSSSGHMQNVSVANKTDTFMAAVLPAATDKQAALLQLGLPADCIGAIGKSWYSPGVIENHPCPGVQRTSRAKLPGLFISQPTTFFEPMRKAAIGTYPLYPDYIGHLEEPRDSSSRRYVLLKESSLSHALATLPMETMPKLLLGSIALGILAVASICAFIYASTCPSGRTRAQPLLWMIAFGSVVSLYSIFSSVFGDGYIEMQKHAVGFLIGIALQAAATSALLAGWLLGQLAIPKSAVTQA